MELKDVDDDDFLKEGWLDETDGLYVQSYTESVGNGWTANQVSWIGRRTWAEISCRVNRWADH